MSKYHIYKKRFFETFVDGTPSRRTEFGNIYRENEDLLLSYGSHYQLAAAIKNIHDQRVVIANSDKVTSSTSNHQNEFHSYASHVPSVSFSLINGIDLIIDTPKQDSMKYIYFGNDGFRSRITRPGLDSIILIDYVIYQFDPEKEKIPFLDRNYTQCGYSIIEFKNRERYLIDRSSAFRIPKTCNNVKQALKYLYPTPVIEAYENAPKNNYYWNPIRQHNDIWIVTNPNKDLRKLRKVIFTPDRSKSETETGLPLKQVLITMEHGQTLSSKNKNEPIAEGYARVIWAGFSQYYHSETIRQRTDKTSYDIYVSNCDRVFYK